MSAIVLTSPSMAGGDCKCRFNGGYVGEGQTVCLKTPSGSSLARCEKVLNNTSWTKLNQPCPYASVTPDLMKNTNQTPFPASPAVFAAKF